MSMRYRSYVERHSGEDDVLDAREFTRVVCDPKRSRTKQGDAKGADVNFIVNQYARTGVLPTMMPAKFGDATLVGSLQDSLQLMAEAGEYFHSLPSKVRERFKNDPGYFVAAATNPEMSPVFVELGLMPAAKEEAAPGGAASGTVGT